MLKTFLTLSLLFNLLTGSFLAWNFYTSKEIKITDRNEVISDFEITSADNFESVFVNQNDSIYKRIWGEAFENQPETAFLISCSYYFVTKDSSLLKDIDISESQLETMYHKHIINFPAVLDSASKSRITH